MTEKELINKLNELQKLEAETEIVEFKEARNTYDLKKSGSIFLPYLMKPICIGMNVPG